MFLQKTFWTNTKQWASLTLIFTPSMIGDMNYISVCLSGQRGCPYRLRNDKVSNVRHGHQRTDFDISRAIGYCIWFGVSWAIVIYLKAPPCGKQLFKLFPPEKCFFSFKRIDSAWQCIYNFPKQRKQWRGSVKGVQSFPEREPDAARLLLTAPWTCLWVLYRKKDAAVHTVIMNERKALL